MGYENLIYYYVESIAPSLIVFIMLALVLDYLYKMIFKGWF